MSDSDDICDQITHSIDDLITSVDAMRWKPAAADDADDACGTDTWVPPDCKARFDALYATIDAFAGAIDNRMDALATKVEGAFAEPSTDTAERDTLTTAKPD